MLLNKDLITNNTQHYNDSNKQERKRFVHQNYAQNKNVNQMALREDTLATFTQ